VLGRTSRAGSGTSSLWSLSCSSGLLLATVKMAQIKGWMWPAALAMGCAVLCAVKWGILAAFFGLCAIGLFSYLRKAHTIDDGHLYTAVSIYLLLGLQ
jgi:hypothetical protein